MSVRLNVVTIVVKDYEEALKFYTERMGFEKCMDVSMGPKSRWLTVAAPGQDVEILLQKPDAETQGGEHAKTLSGCIGQGTTWVLGTVDCQKAYEELSARGVKFTESPKRMPWGIQAVLKDLYGNTFALVHVAQHTATN